MILISQNIIQRIRYPKQCCTYSHCWKDKLSLIGSLAQLQLHMHAHVLSSCQLSHLHAHLHQYSHHDVHAHQQSSLTAIQVQHYAYTIARIQTKSYSVSSSSSTTTSKASNNHTKKTAIINQKLPISITQNMNILPEIPLEDVRNFCFIAHVDHGKSSLASRVLELTGNLGLEQQWTALGHAKLSHYLYTNSNANVQGIVINDDDKNHDLAQDQQQQQQPQQQQQQHYNTELGTTTKKKGAKEQIELLDTLAVEKERGITVKASAASMLFPHPSAKGKHGVLLLNMVDTPGHVDFGTEVVRTLSSVQGAVLLFDAAQGVQAQSLSVHEKAKNMPNIGIIIPALTKVDLPSARVLDVTLSVSELFNFDPDDVVLTSARSRRGIAELLDYVCDKIPPPEELSDDDGKILRAKVVDSWFEPLRGVVCLVQILSGQLTEASRVTIVEPVRNDGIDKDGRAGGSTLRNISSKDHYSVQDIGLVCPHRIRTGKLTRGQMGYVIVGLRDPRQARPGTVMVLHNELSKVSDMILPDSNISTRSQSVLYASVHPLEGDAFDELSNAVDRLALNDTGLEIHRTSGASSSDGGPYLGPGLRVGFQGLLHVEVFQQRLLDEFGLEAIVTPPKVPYKITYLGGKGHMNTRSSDAPSSEIIEDISKWPQQGVRYKVEEPVVNVRIMSPMEYAGNIMDLIKRKRGMGMNTKPIDEVTWLFTAIIPWGEVVTSFHDELKTISAGYASFDTSESDPPFLEADLSKVEIMLNGEIVEPLAFVCHKDSAQSEGRIVCKKLQDVLPRQEFVTVIQAKAENKIIASERIRAYRKDVLTTGGSKSVGGGDITRKKKLLEKQKKGKKRQQATGKVVLSQAAFNSVISRSS